MTAKILNLPKQGISQRLGYFTNIVTNSDIGKQNFNRRPSRVVSCEFNFVNQTFA